MATGLTLHEVEEKKPDGFFPKLFTNVAKNMGDENVDKMHEIFESQDAMAMLRYRKSKIRIY